MTEWEPITEPNPNNIIEKTDKLVADYYEKYQTRPNAILISEYEFNYLCAYYMVWANFIAKEQALNMELMGMKAIPVKHGKMEAVELL